VVATNEGTATFSILSSTVIIKFPPIHNMTLVVVQEGAAMGIINLKQHITVKI
jgi:hypothetical protein